MTTTTLTFDLRPAAPEDADFELQLYASTRRDLLPLGPEVFEGLVGMQFRAHAMSLDLEHPGATREILIVGESPVGRLVVDYSGRHVEVVDIALVPHVRGNGVGTAILRQVIAAADRSGQPSRLHVERTNRAAGLFERLGFVDDGGTALYRTMTRTATA
jgi:ribosomal protein S18 acetylase RimI-like enzyme